MHGRPPGRSRAAGAAHPPFTLPPALERELRARIAAWPADLRARARHRDARGEPRFVNRLAAASSTDLRQLALGPGDGPPWGDEAFAWARATRRPIFRSIGDSTCHWCHVMAHESFEDLEIGGVLSREWIKSTVDREERPDVDAVDMTIVQLANRGHGGWPMTILMDDALRPLSAATYLPVRDGDRGGRAGLLGILTSFAAGDRPGDPQLERRAATIVQALRVHEGRRAEDLGEASRGDEHAGIANEAAYAAIAPPCRGKAIAEGASAAWVCRERTRSRPITSTAA